MSNFLSCLLLGCCLALEVGGVSAATVTPEDRGRPTPAHRPQVPETRILVTFHDERQDRIPVGDPINAYRRRGSYGNSTWSERVSADLAAKYGLEQLAQWPITSLGIHCVVYRVPPTRSVEAVLRQLRRDERIEAAQSMQDFQVMSSDRGDPYLSLQTGIRTMHVEPIHRIATGRNVRIAVIDTGVDEHHPDLAGQVSRVENFVASSPETADDIHGTAVAGIIAASANNGQGIIGVAPDAKLIALKACWQSAPRSPDAVCNSFTLALALNSAILIKPEIINLSLAGPKDPLLERLLVKALNDGMIVVASDTAGSDSAEGFPASVSGVIAVRNAGHGDNGAPVASRSLAAPGTEILTTLPHGAYNFMSGSSFAAAHVSGLIALLVELSPHLTSSQVASILHRAERDPSSLAGIDACGAIAAVHAVAGCSALAEKGPTTPSHGAPL